MKKKKSIFCRIWVMALLQTLGHWARIYLLMSQYWPPGFMFDTPEINMYCNLLTKNYNNNTVCKDPEVVF